MTPGRAVGRLAVCLAPGAVAAVAGGSLGLVAGLCLLGTGVMLVSVVAALYQGDTLSRRSRFAAAMHRRRLDPPRTPRDLQRLETLVAGRVPTAIGVHQWLRPLMADVASTRLRHRHGVDLADPEAAILVPEPLWELVRPGRPEPADRNSRGVTPQELTLLVDQLEAL